MDKQGNSDFEKSLLKINSRLKRARKCDVPGLRSNLKRISSRLGTGENAGVVEAIQSLESRLAKSILLRVERERSIPRLAYPEHLPITSKRGEIVEAIRANQVVIITGETGSGKTTQIPKMCIEAGRGIDGAIGCTQPRRIAAVTVANRIAEEMGEQLGCSVAYKIRFDERSGPDPWVKVMTDGIFLMELHSDRTLRRYDTIIIDEAHERSLNVDFSLGILRGLLSRRRDLKLVITSATLDSEKFSRAFGEAPIIEVSGRLFPVEVRYDPPDPDPGQEDSYIEAAVNAVDGLCGEGADGDILVFMPTEQDINETCEILEGRRKSDIVLPLYSRLAWADQKRIFSGGGSRKIVVATNIAETSITIPGIKYVVDTGLARISRYNTKSRSTSLPVTAISRSSADQRKGRCGRVRNGVCVRLYSQTDYEARPLFTAPEVLRSNLAEVILRMLALGLGDIPSFPFIDPPSPGGIKDGLSLLQELGAVRQASDGPENGRFVLTDKGRKMSRLPVDPRLSRVLLEAINNNCLQEAAVICASLATQDPREWSPERESEARQAHSQFQNPASDFLGILDLWRTYHAKSREIKSHNRLKKFCREKFLSYRRLREWVDVYRQLLEILADEGFMEEGKRVSVFLEDPGKDFKDFYARLHKSVLSGFLSNVAVKKEKNFYSGARGKETMLFPGSGLFNRGADWIVCAEAIETSRMFARTAAAIESGWIEEIGPHLCRYTYSEPHWDRKRGEVTAIEKAVLYGLTVVPGRRVSYGRIDPEKASEVFIRSALVEGDIDAGFAFLEHNRGLVRRFSEMEDKLRRRDILAGDDALAEFYGDKLKGVCDVRTLRKLIRDKGDSFLRMTEGDVSRYMPDADELAGYPDEYLSPKGPIRISYSFHPGEQDDGATLQIPLNRIYGVKPEQSEWLVPGLMRERITALLKGLPKDIRKQLVPLPAAVDRLLAEIENCKGPLLPALGRLLTRHFGVNVPSSAWQERSLPDYLKMRFAIMDSHGRVLAEGRDLQSVQNSITAEAGSCALEKAKALWEKSGITSWDFGEIPESIEMETPGGFGAAAFPALVDEGDAAGIRLFGSAAEARESHDRGVARLMSIHFSRELKRASRTFFPKQETKSARPRNSAGQQNLERAVMLRLRRILFEKPVRTERDFFEAREKAGAGIYPLMQEISRELNPVLQAGRELLAKLRGLERASAPNKSAAEFIAGLRMELESAISEEFIVNYEPGMPANVIRQIKAMHVRAERGIHHLEKDRLKSAGLVKYTVRLSEFRNSVTFSTSPQKKQAINHFAWMIEEYKISLFAPELKTAFPVSPKRLDEKIADIEMMV